MKYLPLLFLWALPLSALAATPLNTKATGEQSEIVVQPHAAPAAPETAAAPAPGAPSRLEQTLHEVEQYLQSLTTIEAKFTQVAPDGSVATGTFYLARPGRLRWEYDPPVPVLIVASGHELVYYDKQLQQVSHIPLVSSLAGFLARDRMRFSDPALRVERVERNPGAIRITVSQRDKPADGKLTLEFADKPMALRNMILTDARRQTTRVNLSDAVYGKPLDPHLFVFVDPRPLNRRVKQ